MTSRETSDLIMMGIGAFTPLDGFMGKTTGAAVAKPISMPSKNGLFWPIPITLSAEQDFAKSIAHRRRSRSCGTPRPESIMGTMKVTGEVLHR